MSAESSRAVFLSYASQDAEAAQRTCEALRTAGVEVWFDQSELRGGDAWDQKIRNQIKACALFLPIISANTQARPEGYFRREWKLAVERTHDMADHVAFLLPVIIDATPDAAAFVPEKFREVQWTRLPGGETSAAFVARVKALLDGVASKSDFRTTPGDVPDTASIPGVTRGQHRWLWIGGLAVAAAVVIVIWASREASVPSPAASSSVAGVSKSPVTVAASAPRLGPKSIAVLPFENQSDDRDANAFFAEGMHEDVITNLLLIRELRCVPRITAMTYRDTKKSPREIADDLGVAYLLNATVRRVDKRVRITATLLNPRTDEPLWIKPYDKDLTDVFALQSELARAIATELKAAISPQAEKLIERRPTENATAYDAYLKSREIRRRGLQNFVMSSTDRVTTMGEKETKFLRAQESLLQASVTLDPKFALAWAELAWIHSATFHGYYTTFKDRSATRKAKAKAAIDTAGLLAPGEPEIILGLGYFYQFCERDYDRAAAQFERVEQLQPNAPSPALALAQLRRSQGRWLDALAQTRRAVALDPSNAGIISDLLVLLTAGRRYGERETELQSFAKIDDGDHRFALARTPFYATGSTRAMEELLRSGDMRAVQTIRRRWSEQHGGYVQPIDPAQLPPIPGIATDESWAPEIHRAVIRAAQGDIEGARTRLVNGPANLRARLELEPANTALLCDLACVEALLGHSEEALRSIQAAMTITPMEFDRWQAPQIEENLGFVYAWTGDRDRAIATYARLLQAPHVSPRVAVNNVHVMRHSFWFYPLRGDPRWEALLADPKNNAPLF